MRTVIACADRNLTIALQFALRRQPAVDVVGSVTTTRALAALAASSPVDLFVIDAALRPTSELIEICRRAGPAQAPASIVVLASDDDLVDDADGIVRKGRAPRELLEELDRLQRARRQMPTDS